MRSSGYTVEDFASGAEFFAFPRLDEFGCLIADINMPGITGLELFRRLMSAGPAIPTILVTAYPDQAARTRALKEGALCYLTKPFVDDELMGCVRTALNGVRPPDETL
jgi:FixJ family two-component response regulator